MGLVSPPIGEPLERWCIYGRPKVGKTRFALSLPERYGEIVYVGWDPSSERLDSVLPQYRNRIHLVQSRPEPGKAYDPRMDAFLIARENWQKRWPQVKTLVWDTFTATALDTLTAISDSGSFSASAHITLGQRGSVDFQTVPMQGDYGAVQNALDRIVTFLFQQPLHLFLICHEGYTESTEAGAKTLIGGPYTVGRATISSFPGRFPTVIRLTRQTIGYGNDAKVAITAWTETQGPWVAGIRSQHLQNPIPIVKLEADPINFHKSYEHFFLPAREATDDRGIRAVDQRGVDPEGQGGVGVPDGGSTHSASV